MSDFFRFLTAENSFIETGFVDKYLGKGRYRVNMNGTKRILQSALREKLIPGMRVIINRTGQDRYIVGTTRQLQTRAENEVVVDG